jgi:hypothetical protein
MNIFMVFLRALVELHTSMGVQGRNILFYVNNCAANPQDMSSLRNVKVTMFLPNCMSLLQPLNLGIVKCFKQL